MEIVHENNANTNILSSSSNDDYNCNNGASYDRNDTFSNTENVFSNIEKDDQCLIIGDINVNIYRYKFAENFTNELFRFSKIHEYDDRKTFKDAWNTWLEENEDLVNIELRRLRELGYEGDIIDKMFKSCRYYFRKKSTEKKAPVQRRNYVGLKKETLEAMDDHIKSNMIIDNSFKPSIGFDEFCKENIDLLKEEITALCRAGINDTNDIKTKFKKTYKNRYFLITSKTS